MLRRKPPEIDEIRKMIESWSDYQPLKEFVEKAEKSIILAANRRRKSRVLFLSLFRGVTVATCIAFVFLINTTNQKNMSVHEQPNPADVVAKHEVKPFWPTVPAVEQTERIHLQPTQEVSPAVKVKPVPAKPTLEQTIPNGQTEQADVQTIAKTYLQRKLGVKFDGYTLKHITRDLPGANSNATLYFARYVNGIPLANSYLTVHVDPSGDVRSFSMKEAQDFPLEPKRYPSPSQAFSRAHAIKALEECIRLVYLERQIVEQNSVGQAVESRPALVYLPSSIQYIDAITGNVAGNSTVSRQTDQVIPVDPTGRRLIAENRNEAFLLMSQEFGLDMSQVSYIGEQFIETGKAYLWEGISGERIALEINDSREVIGFYDERVTDHQMRSVTEEQAKEVAIQFLEHYLMRSIEQLSLSSIHKDIEGGEWHLQFHKAYHNIPVIDHTYHVTIGASTGRVTGFSGEFNRPFVQLPENNQIASKQEAVEEWVKTNPLELVYVWPTGTGKIIAQPQLVFQFSNGETRAPAIDAVTAKAVTPTLVTLE